MPGEFPPAGSFATLAFLAGLAGVLVTGFLAPRRWALSSLALWVGFLSTLSAGVLAVGGGAAPVDAVWASRLALAGLVALSAGGVLCVVDQRSSVRQVRLAAADAETLRRDIDRMNGINVRLEDEIRELRRKARSGEEQRAGSSVVLEATLARQRKALDTAVTQARKHRAVFDGALEGMALLERETLRMVDVNASLARIMGHTAQELAEKTVLDLIAEGADRPGKADLQRCARERRALAVVLARKEGHEIPAEITISVVEDGEGAQLLLVVRDVSDRQLVERDHEDLVKGLRDRLRRAEEAHGELEGRNRTLESANRRLTEMADRKDHYLSSVSHELRTPLTSIRSFSEILLKHGDADAQTRREFVEIIHKESERLTRLVNNVLDLARIEAGAQKLALSEFDARIVVADAVASMQGMAAERKVRVTAAPGDVERTLRADRDRVQQLLMNLVSNAVKFSPEDSEVEVRVEPADTPDRVRLSVVDHGRGIPPEDLEKVFDRFHRVDEESGPPGTGLGLSICREIVNLHGGKIWVESEVGKGSSFRVEFPGVDEMRARGFRTGPVSESQAGLELPRLGDAEAAPATAEVRARRDAWSTTGSLPPIGMR